MGSDETARRAKAGSPPLPPARNVSLRDAVAADLDTLFAIQNDPAWCAMAMVKPRSRATFDEIWKKIFETRAAEAEGAAREAHKVILIDGRDGRSEVCGSIGCFLRDGGLSVGYGLGAEYWGRGIASRAVALLLEDVRERPLRARAAASNAASLRVLEKNGFVIEGRGWEEETERYVACEEVFFVLK